MTEKPEIVKDLGYEINGPGRKYFDNVITDNILDALTEISAVLWTIKDRQIVLEKVLAEKGIAADTLIEAHMPDRDELVGRTVARDEMVQRIFRSFVRRPDDQTAKSADEPSLREIED